MSPEEAGFDARGFRALVRLGLRELSRKGVDLASGARGSTLRQAILSMLVLGAFVAMGILAPGGEQSWARVLVTAAAVLVAMLLLPDTVEAFETRREIVGALPITPRTAALARAASLVILTSLIASCFALPGLLAMRLRFDTPWPRVAAVELAVVTTAFTMATLWHALTVAVGGRLGMDRVRRLCQVALAFTVLATSSLGFLRMVPSARAVADVIAGALPTAWFADLAMGRARAAEAAGAAALITLAVLAAVRMREGAAYGSERAGRAERHRDGLALRVLRAWQAAAATRGPAGRAAAAVGILCLRARGREEAARLQGVGPLMLMVVGLVGGLAVGPRLGLPFVAAAGMASVLQALVVATQSGDAAASWILHATPVSGRELVGGTRRAVMLATVPLPALLLGVVAVAELGLARAAVLPVAFAAIAWLAVSGRMLLGPSMPLSRERVVGQDVAGFVAFQAGIVGGVVAAMVALAVLRELGGLGSLVLLALSSAAVLLGWGTGLLAARRLERLECPH